MLLRDERALNLVPEWEIVKQDLEDQKQGIATIKLLAIFVRRNADR